MANMRVNKWDEFQHYKNKKPTWIKVYRDLLNNLEWHSISGEAAKALVMIWLVAAEDEDMGGKLPCIEKLAFKLRMSEEKLSSLLGELGLWITGLSRAPIEPKETPSTPEKRREEKEKRRTRKAAYSDEFETFWKECPKKKSKGDAFKAWGQAKGSVGWPGAAVVIDAMCLAAKSEDWTKDGGKYIPYPGKWLRAGGWDDEVTTTTRGFAPMPACYRDK